MSKIPCHVLMDSIQKFSDTRSIRDPAFIDTAHHIYYNTPTTQPHKKWSVLESYSVVAYAETPRATAMNELSAAARDLYYACRGTLSKISMSPQDILHLRSQTVASWFMHGAWTMFVTFNPSESNSRGIFQLAGRGHVHW